MGKRNKRRNPMQVWRKGIENVQNQVQSWQNQLPIWQERIENVQNQMQGWRTQFWQNQAHVFGRTLLNASRFCVPQQPFQFSHHTLQSSYPFSDPMFLAQQQNYPSMTSSTYTTSPNLDRVYARPRRAVSVYAPRKPGLVRSKTTQPAVPCGNLRSDTNKIGSRSLRSSGNAGKTASEAGTQSDDSDDVVYLFTVDKKNDFLTELIDLDENVPSSKKRRNLVQSTKSSDKDALEMSLASKENSSSSGQVRLDPKKSLSSTTGLKRKRDDTDADCCRCGLPYDKIRNNGGELYSSGCGHRLCNKCAFSLDPYRCPRCSAKLSNLWKITV